MPERLFLFLQFEFPWELGPPDGRYLLRGSPGGDPERVIVLGTLGALPRAAARGRGWGARRSRTASAQATAEPAAVSIARVTIVDPVPLSAERQARAWLANLDPDREADAAIAVLNRVVYFHRIATADPYVREVSAEQALVIRAGWGEGEQVAGGNWLFARELRLGTRRRGAAGRWPGGRRRALLLRPGERLAQLMGARAAPLLCEEIALRARMDLDQGRLRHAAIELEAAYAAALTELRAEGREDLAVRIAELEQLSGGVGAQARAAQAAADGGPEEETVRHALGRLESALRARMVTGLGSPG